MLRIIIFVTKIYTNEIVESNQLNNIHKMWASQLADYHHNNPANPKTCYEKNINLTS